MGLREGERTRVEGCLHSWASQTPQFTEQGERETVLQSPIKHTFIVPEQEPIQTWNVMEASLHQNGEAKPPQGMNSDNQHGSAGICEWSAIAYVFTHFIYLCLSYSKQIFVQHSKWPWMERIHFSGRGRKDGRIEKTWAQLRISSLSSRTHRHL